MKMKVFLAFLLAVSTATWAYAQESGQAAGGGNGSVEEIVPAHNPGPTEVPQSPVVGGHEVLCNQKGQPVGFTEPRRPTTVTEDRQWKKFASHQGWLTQREAVALDAQILRKSKAYTDQKVKAVHQRVDRLAKRVGNVEDTLYTEGGVVDTVNKDNAILHGGKDAKGKHIAGVVETVSAHAKTLDALQKDAKAGASHSLWLTIMLLVAAAFLVLILLILFRRMNDLEKEVYGDDAQHPIAPAAAAAAPEQSAPTGEEDLLAAEADPSRI